MTNVREISVINELINKWMDNIICMIEIMAERSRGFGATESHETWQET